MHWGAWQILTFTKAEPASASGEARTVFGVFFNLQFKEKSSSGSLNLPHY